jgi:hypothetical protein
MKILEEFGQFHDTCSLAHRISSGQPSVLTAETRYWYTALLRAHCTRLGLAAKQSAARAILISSIRYPLFSLLATYSDNPNPSRSGKKIRGIAKKFPDPARFSRFCTKIFAHVRFRMDEAALFPLSRSEGSG